MAAKLDRRQARSRAALRKALITLIRRKGFDAITVQDILDEADVGRSTFYSHCTGKEDLLRKSIQELKTELRAERKEQEALAKLTPAPAFAFSLFMFEHIDAHRQLYYNVARSRGGEIVLGEIRRLVADFAREDLEAYGLSPGVSMEFAVQFIAGGFMSVVTWWLDRRPGIAATELDVMFRGFVERGLGVSGPEDARSQRRPKNIT